jgi:type IV pilus assembly protein PilA
MKRQAARNAGLSPLGFTLVELVVAIAIISILVAIAIPAYNNYTAKSAFSEVVLATAPAKAAITVCAQTGDCVSANQIALGGSGQTLTAAQESSIAASVAQPSVSLASPTLIQTGSAPAGVDSAMAAIWAYSYNNAYTAIAAQYASAGVTITSAQLASDAAASATTMAQEDASFEAQTGFTYFLQASGGGVTFCGAYPAPPTDANCTALAPVASSTLDADLNNPSNPYLSAYPAEVASANAAAEASAAALYSSEVASAIAAATPGGATSDDIPCVGSQPGCSPSTKYAATVSHDAQGDIYATAASGVKGLAGEQFVLMPTLSSGRVDWVETGSCKTRAGGALC